MKTAFVLSGGGAAGSYQFGCLKALLGAGIQPDFMTANSAGSLNATGISFGTMAETEAMWRSIRCREDVFSDNLFLYIKALFGSNSIWSSKPLKKKIEKIIRGRSAKIPYWVNYVDLRSGKLMRQFSQNDNAFADAVLASASIPIITAPVKGYMVDGGIRENTPLKWAIDQGADRIFVFLSSPRDEQMNQISAPRGLINIAARCVSILSDEATWDDIRMCQKYNERGWGRKIELHWLAPDVRTIGTLDFNQNAIARGIDQGYADALNVIKGMNQSQMNFHSSLVD